MTAYKGDILIVDDRPDNLRVLAALLTEQQYKVRSVISGRLALTVAQEAQPDVILLDIMMPDMDGYAVCQQLKRQQDTAEIPIIFLSAMDASLDKVKAFQVGGVDFISKPFHAEEVILRIDTQLKLRQARQELEVMNAELERRVQKRTAQLEAEIAERLKVQAKLLHLALHDELTGLPNRALLMKRLKLVLTDSRHHPDSQFAVFFVDCDRFKLVNDSLGHSAGDQLLIAIARRLEACLRAGSMVARLGGDEFIILLENLSGIESATQIAETIQREIKTPFQLCNSEFSTSVSIGIVMGGPSYEEPDHLLRDADTAMYKAKESGKGCYHVFSQNLHQLAVNRFSLEVELRHALRDSEFIVYYQPIVGLGLGQLYGFEVLIRWRHPRRGLLKAGDFMPLAEESDIVELVDFWMLQQVFQTIAAWKSEGLIQSPFRVGINFSVRHFTQDSFIQRIDDLLQRYSISGQYLSFEITEHGLMHQSQAVIKILEQLRERGIHIAIDDFGTGYSSLSYLHRFPVDALKIDRGFVRDLHSQPQKAAIVRAIIALAEGLKLETIAEGIETAAEQDRLAELGSSLAQGDLFAQPMDETAAKQLLKQRLDLCYRRDKS